VAHSVLGVAHSVLGVAQSVLGVGMGVCKQLSPLATQNTMGESPSSSYMDKFGIYLVQQSPPDSWLATHGRVPGTFVHSA